MTKSCPYRLMFFLLLWLPLLLSNEYEGADLWGQDQVIIATNREVYRYGESITVRFRNIMDEGEKIAVMTAGCGMKDGGYLPRLVVERKDGGEWKRAGAPVCIAIATPPIYLAPGQSKSVTFPVDTGLDSPRVAGYFRYRFDIRTEKEGGYPAETALPVELRTSPSFRITADPD